MSELGDRIIEGMEQAVAYAKGEAEEDDYRITDVEVEPADVKAVRDRLDMTQEEFAAFLEISVHTLRKWEQGTRRPEGPARTLLRIVEREPEAALRALHGRDEEANRLPGR